MIDLTPIMEAIIALVVAVITAFVIPWLKGKIDADKLEQKKETMRRIAAYLNQKWGAGTFECVIRDSYRNMREIMEQHMDVVEKAKAAFEANGVTPVISPIRGGTDGARLSFMGLPCPNLSTGGYNFHGRKEMITVEAMEAMVNVLESIVRNA